jgi:hypothetical protein
MVLDGIRSRSTLMVLTQKQHSVEGQLYKVSFNV